MLIEAIRFCYLYMICIIQITALKRYLKSNYIILFITVHFLTNLTTQNVDISDTFLFLPYLYNTNKDFIQVC